MRFQVTLGKNHTGTMQNYVFAGTDTSIHCFALRRRCTCFQSRGLFFSPLLKRSRIGCVLRFTFARFFPHRIQRTSFQTLGILMNTGKYRHNIRSQDIKGILFINFLCPDNKIFLPDFYIVIEHNGKLCRKMGAHPSYPKVISSCKPGILFIQKTVTLSCPAYSSLRIRPVPLGDALSTITICLLPIQRLDPFHTCPCHLHRAVMQYYKCCHPSLFLPLSFIADLIRSAVQ